MIWCTDAITRINVGNVHFCKNTDMLKHIFSTFLFLLQLYTCYGWFFNFNLWHVAHALATFSPKIQQIRKRSSSGLKYLFQSPHTRLEMLQGLVNNTHICCRGHGLRCPDFPLKISVFKSPEMQCHSYKFWNSVRFLRSGKFRLHPLCSSTENGGVLYGLFNAKLYEHCNNA